MEGVKGLRTKRHYAGVKAILCLPLAALAGCEIRDGFVKVDEWQRTSIANIFCGGEPTGIGGLERSLGLASANCAASWRTGGGTSGGAEAAMPSILRLV